MLNHLENTSATLSLEARCGEASLESAMSQVPEFIGKLRGFFNDWRGSLKFTPGVPAFLKPFDFIKAIQKTTYTDFKQVDVFVPQGLKVPYLTYSAVLLQSTDFLLKTETDFIDPYLKWLGVRLGQPSTLNSVASTLSKAADQTSAMEKIEKAYHECFVSAGQRQGSVSYHQAIGRQADWQPISEQLVSLTTRVNDDLHARLLEKMRRIDELLAALVKRADESPELYKLSPATLSDLVQHAYAAARFFEFYGLTRYRVDEYRSAINDTIKKLEVFVK